MFCLPAADEDHTRPGFASQEQGDIECPRPKIVSSGAGGRRVLLYLTSPRPSSWRVGWAEMVVCGGDVVNGSHHMHTHKDKKANERQRAAGDLRGPAVLESWVGV